MSGRSIARLNSGGSFGAAPLEQHIGLGKSAQIVSLEIIWPGDPDHPQKFTNLAVNQAIAVKQGVQEYTRIERHTVRLGGGRRAAVAPMKRSHLSSLCARCAATAAERHPATAIILKIDRAHRSFVGFLPGDSRLHGGDGDAVLCP
jgi:hypothetical protein